MTTFESSDAPLVTCEKVTRRFGPSDTQVTVLQEITCTITAGTRVALSGPSGSGKSTLLHLMAGLDTPTEGRIGWPALGGHPLGRPGRIGVVFQGPSLIPDLDVTENVMLPLLLDGCPDADAAARARDALTRIGVEDLAGKLPEELSGGQAQRAAVARVLAARPALILADEPTGQLDHRAAAAVVDVLLAASDELGAALVISTHDRAVSDRLPERWQLRDGQIHHMATVSGVQ